MEHCNSENILGASLSFVVSALQKFMNLRINRPDRHSVDSVNLDPLQKMADVSSGS